MTQPTPPQNMPPRAAGASILGAMFGVLAVVLADVHGAAHRAPGAGSWQGIVSFTLFGWALGSVAFTPLVLLRARAHEELEDEAPSAGVFIGAFEALLFFAIAILGQDPRSPSGDARVYALVGSCIGWGLLHWWWARQGFARAESRVRVVATVLVLIAAIAMLRTLAWNGSEWLRVALDLVLVIAVADLLEPLNRPGKARNTLIVAACALALTLLACSSLLLRDADARKLLHRRSSHVRSWSYLVELVVDDDRDRATNLFGGHDCDTGDRNVHPVASEGPGGTGDDNCNGRGPTSSGALTLGTASARGAARGSDVLMLSIDALRWDALQELQALTLAMGPHATFLRAVSPAAATKESLSATLRGVSMRYLNLEHAPGSRGPILWRDPNPTLGHALQRAGYQAVTVPTNHMLDPRNGVQAGFQSIWVANFDARKAPAERAPTAPRSYVPTSRVLPLMLDVARRTPGPLCVWVHAMESHAGYYWGDGQVGPPGVWAYRRSVHDLAVRLAEFVREFAAIRGKPPVIAVFGDHGEEFDEHGGLYHGTTVYAEQTRVGFLLSGPGIRGGNYDAAVSTTSLPGTLLELLGLPHLSAAADPSLLSAMEGHAQWPSVVASEMPASGNRMSVGYLAGRYHLVRDPVHDVDELFDVDRDPREQHDISREQPAALKRMRSLAHAWDETQ